ncbi:hypothetical protein CcaverHIS002_0108600 [Cutaneotrichosporon cavernicola]|uniref:Ricin B lectin domain-containing protein n=1 Tax=Cutaneotrichosporon cavernicola TaxID=279322 RepID=A0AA48HZ36_9TREE|nr:uncharacterized protein CcaverHIS019_0108540 [Cutaneotrichosporon cavernicola]BEI80331.1 hypothetical protein CcaverHIS002_0108600 [Cutaneotrichosporon cavernicola]BEI88136.1 hypothetical protein CcaverHIS019_0108540 [Cutaneotrichosporon cavernicola]BEI95906.1 hypothetical protein CcaverHIS631_0108550 [Cutaneotrichosporon cavernicola]BEJ03681.1 hypothetical protein CcaverHIS641_0108560 [Cutaneotrichosporon cavernicola]
MLLWTLLMVTVAATSVHPGRNNRRKCLDVEGANGDLSQVYISKAVTFTDCCGSATQDWEVRRGTTFIKLAGTDWCVDVGTHRRPPYGWHPANGELAKLYPCGTLGHEAGQTFEFKRNVFSVKEKALGDFCLDLRDGNLGPGNQLQMWNCYKHNQNQVFSIS